MIYVTAFLPPRYHQMTLEELIYQTYNPRNLVTKNISNTRTDVYNYASYKLRRSISTHDLIEVLEKFNEFYAPLRSAKREDLYETFYIPKRDGGRRRIDAPKDELMMALRTLKTIFEKDFHALYHTSAFAYVHNRSTTDAVKRHQQNESKWFCKFDLHDFFGSTTLDFVMKQLGMIFPFSEVIKVERGAQQLRMALELAFLNGGLPQGTPISPLITNIMMIPIDFVLYNTLRDFEKQTFVYTRYADDFIISSRYDFDYKKVEGLIIQTLRDAEAPFTLNTRKTRYCSSAGKNWILGVMLNKDNVITVGYKNKRRFESMLHNYYTARINRNNVWSVDEIQHLLGLYSYYKMVESETMEKIIQAFNSKWSIDVIEMMKDDVKI